MTFAQIKLLVPNTLPSKRDAVNSMASVAIPLVKAMIYRSVLRRVALSVLSVVVKVVLFSV